MTSRQVCQHFLRGSCRFGNDCRLSHHTGGNASSHNINAPPQSSASPRPGPNQRQYPQSRGGAVNQRNNSSQGGYATHNGGQNPPSGSYDSYGSQPQPRDNFPSHGGRYGNRNANNDYNSQYGQGTQRGGANSHQNLQSRHSGGQQQRYPSQQPQSYGGDRRNLQYSGNSQDDGDYWPQRGPQSNRGRQASQRGQMHSNSPNPPPRQRQQSSQYGNQYSDDYYDQEAPQYGNQRNQGQFAHQQAQQRTQFDSYQQPYDDSQSGFPRPGGRQSQQQQRGRGSQGYAQPHHQDSQWSDYHDSPSQQYNQPYAQNGRRYEQYDQRRRGGYQQRSASQPPQNNYGRHQQNGNWSNQYDGEYQDEAYDDDQAYNNGYANGNSGDRRNQTTYIEYDGPSTNGRPWYTRGDGSRLREVPVPNHSGRSRGMPNMPSPLQQTRPSHQSTGMDIDEIEPDETPDSDFGAPRTFDTELEHAPPPLYAAYYSKREDLDEQQLELYDGDDFAGELPEDPPPFEHCYKPGESPKQFGPRK